MVKQFDLTKPGMTLNKAYSYQKKHHVYDEIMQKYRDPMTRYAFAVLEGDILAGEDIRLNAFRHLQDLTRQNTDDFPYHYDLQYCHEILNFASVCPDVSTGKPLPLDLWQQSILCDSQGWRDKKGERRYHQVVFSVSRTNGKTYITNILLTYQYIIGSDGQFNQDMAYIAPVTQQSKKGWRYIKTTFLKLQAMAAFRRLFKATQTRIGEDEVKSRINQNQLLRLSHESGQFDSYHFSFAVSDEAGDDGRIGLIKENNGKITSGTVQTPNSQFWQISTAYPDSTSQFYLDEQMVRDAMKHDDVRKLDDFLMINYQQDSTDEEDKPETWVKSNPRLTVAGQGMLDNLISERDTKRENGTFAEFENKNLNLWIKVKENRYLNVHDVMDAQLDEAPIDITGRNVYIGFDLSKLADDTAIALVFPYLVDDQPNYFIMQHSWIPTNHTHGDIALKEKQDGIAYRGAEKLGFCEIARNRFGYIDEDSVTDWLLDFVEDNDLQVRFFIFDRWSTADTVEKLTKLDQFPILPLRQTSHDLDKPTTEFRKAIQTHRVHYLKDPIIQYSLTNAILVGDSAGIKVDKDRGTAKIDCVDAIIDAMNRAIYEYSDYKPDDSDGKKLFDGWTEKEKHDYFMNYRF